MKNYILATLTANKGRIVSYLVGLIITLLGQGVFLAFDVELSEAVVTQLNIGLPILLAWIIDGIVIHVNSQGTKAIQEVLQDAPAVSSPVVVDGVPGKGTIAAVTEAATGEIPPSS